MRNAKQYDHHLNVLYFRFISNAISQRSITSKKTGKKARRFPATARNNRLSRETIVSHWVSYGGADFYITLHSPLSPPVLARWRTAESTSSPWMRYFSPRRASARVPTITAAGTHADIRHRETRRRSRQRHSTCCRCRFSYIRQHNVSRLVTKQTYQAPTWRDASHDIPAAHAYT